MTHDYLGFEDSLEEDDYGFMLDAQGRLKGIWIPASAEDENVPDAIVQLLNTTGELMLMMITVMEQCIDTR